MDCRRKRPQLEIREEKVIGTEICCSCFMMKSVLFAILCIVPVLFSAQQNTEFATVSSYFTQHRKMIDREFQDKGSRTSQIYNKSLLSQDRKLFMQKLDSLENSAYQYALITVRNREDLGKLQQEMTPITSHNSQKPASLKAEYPGGVENLKNQIVSLLYVDAFSEDMPSSKANVLFTVERDGSVSSVRAEGLNASFNKQAEIAIYRLPEKFTPANINGVAVRYKYRIPLTLNMPAKDGN